MRTVKIGLQGTMAHEGVLQAIHLMDLCRRHIDPIDHLSFLDVGEQVLMLGTQKGSQEDVPIALILLPPFEIDMKGSVLRWL
jgi:hypothetical protein